MGASGGTGCREGGDASRRVAMEVGESFAASVSEQTEKEMWMRGETIPFSRRIAKATGTEETVKQNSEGES